MHAGERWWRLRRPPGSGREEAEGMRRGCRLGRKAETVVKSETASRRKSRPPTQKAPMLSRP